MSIGNLIGGIGKVLGLPEIGISELLGGTKGGYDAGAASLANTAKNNVQTGGYPVECHKGPICNSY